MAWAFKSIGKLDECADDWQSINRAATNTPLLDFHFVSDLVSEFSTGRELIASFRKDGDLLAMAILSRANPLCWQTLQPANAPIGLWVSKPSVDMEGVVRKLAADLPMQFGMISLTQQDPEILPRPQHSRHLSTLDYIVTASITVPESFAAYFQSRSKNFRHNISRQRNRLKREGIATRIEFLSSPADMPRAVIEYSQLECASWKGEINSAVRMDEPQGRFYLKLMNSFAIRGEALVYRYFFGERLVAADLCLCRNATLIILKTACDESPQGLSPAHLMRLDAFAELFDKRNIRKIEFYGPVKEWHTRLTDDTRQMYHINYYRWPIMRLIHQIRMRSRRGNMTNIEPSPSPQEAVEPVNTNRLVLG